MSVRLAIRPSADRDVERQAEFNAEESGAEELVLRFLLAVEEAYRFLQEHPRSGAPRHVRNTRLIGAPLLAGARL